MILAVEAKCHAALENQEEVLGIRVKVVRPSSGVVTKLVDVDVEAAALGWPGHGDDGASVPTELPLSPRGGSDDSDGEVALGHCSSSELNSHRLKRRCSRRIVSVSASAMTTITTIGTNMRAV